jgi:hypothetical protein
MPKKTFRRSRTRLPLSLQGLGNNSTVIIERANDRMLLQKRQSLLLEAGAFEQLADCSQLIRCV